MTIIVMSQPGQPHTNITLYEDRLYEKTETAETTRHLVVFSLSHEFYGIDIVFVKEVLQEKSPVFVPNVPPHILGLISLRGNIYTIVDMRKIFNLSPNQTDEAHQIVIIEAGGVSTGLWVNGKTQTLEIPVSKISLPVITIDKEKLDLIEAQTAFEGKQIAILNAHAIIQKTQLKEAF
jgi:purine-binding chemotaxis protein CheW